MADQPVLTRIAPGLFSVDTGDRRERVWVAGPATDRWAFWNGHVFHATDAFEDRSRPDSAGATSVAMALAAPMPATVLRVLVTPGSAVRKGDTLVILEAMKMELPVRALSDGTVSTVRCREGELVQADQVLVEIAGS